MEMNSERAILSNPNVSPFHLRIQPFLSDSACPVRTSTR
jgi:hypothetical protein